MTRAAAHLRPLLGTGDPGATTDGSHWVDDACAVDRRVLRHAVGPVLDVGCGPGRHAAELTARGISSLGIDITPAALDAARARGATVLERSVFDDLPGAGRWRTALLLDGNIGIGGEPVRLLRRVHDLLAPDGRVLVEVAGPGGCEAAAWVRFDIGEEAGPGFLLAGLCASCLVATGERAGFTCEQTWSDGHRWFGLLHRRPGWA